MYGLVQKGWIGPYFELHLWKDSWSITINQMSIWVDQLVLLVDNRNVKAIIRYLLLRWKELVTSRM